MTTARACAFKSATDYTDINIYLIRVIRGVFIIMAFFPEDLFDVTFSEIILKGDPSHPAHRGFERHMTELCRQSRETEVNPCESSRRRMKIQSKAGCCCHNENARHGVEAQASLWAGNGRHWSGGNIIISL